MALNKAIRDNTAAIAAKFGVTIRALRLYEELGMLKPPRNRVGWRVYGDEEEARLGAILTLKKLGLTITRIARLLSASGSDLDTILADQEAALHRRRRETDVAINLARIARASLRRGDVSTIRELTEALHGNAQIPAASANEESNRAKTDTNVDFAGFDSQTLLSLADGWFQVHADVAKLAEIGDPASPAALEVARRTDALIRQTTNNDLGVMARATSVWEAALNDPQTAPLMPLTRPQWEFLHRALGAFRERRARH